jgi:hypothetical protein
MLAKLTTGEPNVRLAMIFHMSRRKLERLMKEARDALVEHFVPRHLGWDHVERERLLQRNLLIPNALFGNPENNRLITVIDGSYIYIFKSSNFGFQMKTYVSERSVLVATARIISILRILGPVCVVVMRRRRYRRYRSNG